MPMLGYMVAHVVAARIHIAGKMLFIGHIINHEHHTRRAPPIAGSLLHS